MQLLLCCAQKDADGRLRRVQMSAVSKISSVPISLADLGNLSLLDVVFIKCRDLIRLLN